MIRQGRWKLHEYFEDGGLELYDLHDDIGEAINLADKNPEQAAELHARLRAWRRNLSAPMPTTPNPRFSAEAEARAIAEALRGGG